MSENRENSVVKDVLKIFTNEWNKQVILYGPPGTSKTYSATIIAAEMLAGRTKDTNEELDVTLQNKLKEILKDKDKADRLKEKLEEDYKKEKLADDEMQDIINKEKDLYKLANMYLACCPNYKIVQFHPSYSYEDFVRGITVKPEGDKVKYEVEAKIIEKFCDDNEDKDRMVLVIDEINRAPLASVLGELIYGLEYRDEKISTPYKLYELENGKELNEKELKEKELKIPSNLYIIGTMNTADRSIGSIDYAVRRRFAFVQVKSEESKIKDSWKEPELVGTRAEELYKKLMDKKDGIFAENMLQDTELDVEDIKIGHTYFLGKDDEGIEYLKYRIRYQIWPIYEEYIKDGIISSDGKDRFAEILKDERFEDIAKEIRGTEK